MKLDALGRISPNSRLFLAEGKSEAGFIQKVLDLNGDKDSLVYCFGGISKLPPVLKSISGVPGFGKLRAFGIMMDAEANIEARITSLINQLGNFGVSIRNADIEQSQVVSHGACQVCIYLSPGFAGAGRIEDTVMVEIRQNTLWACIENYVLCAEDKAGKRLDEKAIVQTFISTQMGNLCGVGSAFAANILDVRHSAYDRARAFVQSLI